MGSSSLARDRTWAPALGVQSHQHWTTGKVPSLILIRSISWCFWLVPNFEPCGSISAKPVQSWKKKLVWVISLIPLLFPTSLYDTHNLIGKQTNILAGEPLPARENWKVLSENGREEEEEDEWKKRECEIGKEYILGQRSERREGKQRAKNQGGIVGPKVLASTLLLGLSWFLQGLHCPWLVQLFIGNAQLGSPVAQS